MLKRFFYGKRALSYQSAFLDLAWGFFTYVVCLLHFLLLNWAKNVFYDKKYIAW